MVDKVFADWQGNPENEFPHLDTKRKIAPFGSKQFNKFTLTNIPPAKTLDFESNLCYCYDCDLEQDFYEVKLPKRTGELSPEGLPIFESEEEAIVGRSQDNTIQDSGQYNAQLSADSEYFQP